MPKRLSKPAVSSEPLPEIIRFPAKERVKNPAAVALGKLGGSKGGRIRAAKLTPEKRREIAQKAASARWQKPSE